MKVKCEKCGHEWEYTGYKTKFLDKGIEPYVICPVCHHNIRIKKEIEK